MSESDAGFSVKATRQNPAEVLNVPLTPGSVNELAGIACATLTVASLNFNESKVSHVVAVAGIEFTSKNADKTILRSTNVVILPQTPAPWRMFRSKIGAT